MRSSFKVALGREIRFGDVNPELEPYKTNFEREKILVFDLTHLQSGAHSRAFDEVSSVMGMIERRLAEGQQLAQIVEGEQSDQ